MKIFGLHHFNIKAPESDLERVKQFYMELLGLKEGFRPPFSVKGSWLYLEKTPLLHLYVDETAVVRSHENPCLDHVAFSCKDITAFMKKLKKMNVEFTTAPVPGMDMVQLFFKDPVGIKIELNFTGEDFEPS
jgi:catechol 2,3-dioxygenase-like lactoylglutathione lyase family enzyme